MGPDQVPVAPGVVNAAQQKSETAAAVGKADFQRLRQFLESAGKDQAEYGALRFGWHPHQPGQHVLGHSLRAKHVPRMNQHRRANIRAMGKKAQQGLVIQVFVAHMIADLRAHMAVFHATRHLSASQVDVLQRHLAQRLQTGGMRRTHFQSQIIKPPGRGVGLGGGFQITEQDRRGAQNLHIHIIAIQFLHPAAGGPERVIDRAKFLVAQHDVAAPGAVLS